MHSDFLLGQFLTSQHIPQFISLFPLIFLTPLFFPKSPLMLCLEKINFLFVQHIFEIDLFKWQVVTIAGLRNPSHGVLAHVGYCKGRVYT